MADTHPYDLVVDLGEKGNPKVKTKLVKYFQSKKSNGGDCLVEYDGVSRTATLSFRTPEARKRVLEKEKHEVEVDQRKLKLTVHLPDEVDQETPDENNGNPSLVPPDQPTYDGGRSPEAKVQMESGDADASLEDEDPCPTSAVLSNMPEEMNEMFLVLLVENVLKRSDHQATQPDFTLEILPEIHSAVVTFHSGKENTDFVTRCPSNRIFNSKKLTVRPLEVTTKVRIEDIPSVSLEYLQLYFENLSQDVVTDVSSDGEGCAIITFTSPKAVHRVTEKKRLMDGKPIKAFPFYESLGTALYGKDRPVLKLPAAFSVSIDPTVCQYLLDYRKAAETIYKDLEGLFCKAEFKQSTVSLSPLPSLLQKQGVNAKVIQGWAHEVKAALNKALSMFKSLQLEVPSAIWAESEEKIGEAVLNEAVVLVPDKDKGVLSLAGLEDTLSKLKKSLHDILDGIARKDNREKTSKTEKCPLLPSIYHILFQDGLHDKILQEYPEVKLAYDKESNTFTSYGLSEEVLGVNRKIMDGVLALKRQILEIDTFILEFLKSEDQQKLTSCLLTSHGIDAALEVSGKMVQLLAVSTRSLNEAQDELKNRLISQHITVEDNNVLQMPEWKDLVTGLEVSTNSSFKKVLIQTSILASGQQVVVSGFKEVVKSIHNDLNNFLHQNADVQKDIPVKPGIIVKYIEEHKKRAWSEHTKDKVTVSFNSESISLKGPRADVTDCIDMFNDVISSVVFDSLNVQQAGGKKIFRETETMYVASAMTTTGCLVQLVDEVDGGQGVILGAGPKPTYVLQSDGVEIAVCNADMCSYPVDAVVNASTQDLQHNQGLSGALLKAAGRQLQDECDNLIQQRGQLKPGDCVVTSAGGHLSCKHIIHAVGPRFSRADSQKAVGQLRRAVKKSLELAEEHGCLSVALPLISRNLGFPLDLCAGTIVNAVKDHCSDRYGDQTLKRIHFVNNDNSAVQAMEAAVRKQFGNHGTSDSQQNLPFGSTTSRHVRAAVRKPNSDQVLTKEGLCITLTKGNIEDATTEVVVNTVGEDLVLKQGAVSNAILGAAGPKLQQLISQQQTRGTVGDVIITDGCRLKSDRVFHAVAPHWNNGQGSPEKHLSHILHHCLNQAEGNSMASITFPALGTGNLGFPKNLVASLMLDEVLKFSRKKQPKALKEVVFCLHPRDAQTVQAFTDEFKNRFTTTGSPATTATPTTGLFSKITSKSGMHEAKVGNVDVQIVSGDITQETTDIIVNSSNQTFNLQTGVSKAILNAAGPSVMTECAEHASQGNQSLIMTQPGNLRCKKILHLIGQSDPGKINMMVKDALQMCVTQSYSSISFPAIGTGQANVQAGQVADAMLDAVADVVSKTPQSSLKTVRIVVFQPPMLKDFHSSLQKKEGSDAEDKGSVWGRLKSFFTGATASKPQKEEDFVILSRTVEPACFHICGESQAKVESAKKWISELISKHLSEKEIKDRAILSLSPADRKRITDIQTNMGVQIKYSQPQALLTIEGESKDVLQASTEIEKMLSRVREEKDLQSKVEIAGTLVDWQHEVQGAQFQSFDPTSNFYLEQALAQQIPSVEVQIHGQYYKVTMPEGPATNATGKSLKVKRIDKLDNQPNSLPKHWDPTPSNTMCKTFDIQASSKEYTEILTLFQASCKCSVLKIERIQNPSMWQSLQIKKKTMEDRNGHKNNVRRLFHGTDSKSVDQINHNGFNRSYAGRNAAAYGNGTYFAVNAAYSASDTYSKPDPQGQKYMYLCCVLTGDYCQGASGMIAPPAKSSSTNHLYDSVVDRMTNPSMFIVFHDHLAYPEYLITFRN